MMQKYVHHIDWDGIERNMKQYIVEYVSVRGKNVGVIFSKFLILLHYF